MLISCASAPKYRAGSGAIPRIGASPLSGPDSVAALEIALSPPVRNFNAQRISSPFGARGNAGSRGSEFHKGLDIRADGGEEVLAAAAGRVAFAGRRRGYGNLVIIDHGHLITTAYAHLFYAIVRKGEEVGAGEIIGRAGKRGVATGTHLHFEVRRSGRALDPAPYLWLDSTGP